MAEELSEPKSRARQLLAKLIEVDKIINKVSANVRRAEEAAHGHVVVAINEGPSFNTPPSNKKLSQIGTSARSPPPVSISTKLTELGMGNSAAASVSLSGTTSGKKASTLKSSNRGAPSSSSAAANSNSLDGGITNAQMSYCPKCYAELTLGSLRRHMAEECTNNEVSCPEHDCVAIFPAQHLKIHLATECIAAKRRKKLVEQARQRKEKEKEALRLAQEAAMVYVEPKIAAVKDDFLMDDMSYHSGEQFTDDFLNPPPPIEKEVTKGPCTACHREVEYAHMSRHRITDCSWRAVYCPNHHSGCTMQVPYCGIDAHLKNECLIERFKNDMIVKAIARCVQVKCIGCGALTEVKHLNKHEVNECVNRKVPCRNAHLGCTTMVRDKNRARHEEVDGSAKIRYCLYLTGEGSYMNLGEDDIQCPWTIELWVYRISSREAVKQHIRNAMEMIPQFFDAFLSEYAWKAQMDDLTKSLKNQQLGLAARDEIMSILADTVEAFEDAVVVTTEVSTMLGCALMSAKRAMTEFAGPEAEYARPNLKGDSDIGRKLSFERMNLRRYDPVKPAPKEETGVSRLNTAATPGSNPSSRPTTAQEDADAASVKLEREKRGVLKWVPPAGYYGVSALAVMMKLCAAPPLPVTQDTPPEKKTKQKNVEKSNIDEKDHRSEKNVPEDEEEEEEELGPIQDPPPPAAEFLFAALKPEDRGQNGLGIINQAALRIIMKWCDWYDVIDILTNLLKVDMHMLHMLRLAGGIIKEDKVVEDDDSVTTDGTSPSKVAQLTDEEIQAKEEKKRLKVLAEDKKKKREKEKLRREMKRNKGKKALEEDADAEAKANEVEEVEERRTPEEIAAEKKAEAREKKRALREKLVPRMIDAAKACAGRDCIVFSDTPNKRGAVSKICLDMSYPGEYEEFLPPVNKRERAKKIWFENEGGGECGVVCADTVLGGSERYTFGKAIPRERWTHISFTAHKEPTNRITMYMNATLVGQIKDCAFPLPMAGLAGSTNLTGFSGCLLDTRIWTKQRSALETRGTMNSLISLEDGEKPLRSDYDLTKTGLVGWWTYEDGPDEEQFKLTHKVTDVSEHRAPTILFRSIGLRTYDPDHDALVAMNATIQMIRKNACSTKYNYIKGQASRFWSWVNADDCPLPWEKALRPGEDRPLPMPAYSAVGVCLFELHRLRLAQKGRQLHKQINCPLGCEDFILKKDLRFHVQYLCTQRKVTCRFAPLCKDTFIETKRVKHEEADCVYLKKNMILVSHQKKQSVLRPCPACSALVRVRDQAKHDRDLCVHRTIHCEHPDCEESFQAHRLKYHLRFECESKTIKKRHLLIQRARERTHYPREWGAVIEYDVDNEEVIEEEKNGSAIAPLVEEEEPDEYQMEVDKEGNLVLDDEGKPIPVLDNDGNPIVISRQKVVIIPKDEYEMKMDEDGALVLDEEGKHVPVLDDNGNRVVIPHKKSVAFDEDTEGGGDGEGKTFNSEDKERERAKEKEKSTEKPSSASLRA